MRPRRIIDAEKISHKENKEEKPNFNLEQFYDETAFQNYYPNQYFSKISCKKII